jgi:hypothetical protein
MGKWIVLLVVVTLGFIGYRSCFYKSPAYQAYLQWAAAIHEGDCKTLYALADAEAVKWVDTFCKPAGGFTAYGVTLTGRSAADMVQEMRGTPAGAMRGFRHELESEKEASDGTVDLSVIESVAARPSNFSKNAPPTRQSVKLRKTGEAWKVVGYSNKDL